MDYSKGINTERWLSLEDYQNEVWKDIVGYEGLYKVSNIGRVKSLGGHYIFGNGYRDIKEHIVKILTNKFGYLVCYISKNGITKKKFVHRLVGVAFIENTLNLPQINHKDENKKNNFVFVNDNGSVDAKKSNIEWCTNLYNRNYGTRNERAAAAMKKPVRQYSVDGVFIKEWDSASDVKRLLGIERNCIYCVCNGEMESAGGFLWRYSENCKETKIQSAKKRIHGRVQQLTKDGRSICIYRNLSEASNVSGFKANRIGEVVRGVRKSYKGFIWREII